MEHPLIYMKRALRLARRGAGRVSPNPLVGAVLVRDGAIVGEGYHVYDRVDHAETVAIRQAGDRARGSALFINLEPCCHVGRTPPCVDAILAAGIRQVYVATADPNPLVSGRGIQILRENGVAVEEGLCRAEALTLNEKFFHFVQTGRPFTLLKLGLSLDGRIATRTGESRWITGEAARRQVQRLRFEYDAVLVGINTVMADDPRLDCRSGRPKSLARVILDTRLKTPLGARLFEANDPVIIFHGLDAATADRSELGRRARLTAVESDDGRLDWRCVLASLAGQGITSLIIEGGGRVASSALKAGVVDKINFFYAPKIIGAEGVPGVGGLDVDSLAAVYGIEKMRAKPIGGDLCLEGYPSRHGA